jgi:hypothetical protein
MRITKNNNFIKMWPRRINKIIFGVVKICIKQLCNMWRIKTTIIKRVLGMKFTTNIITPYIANKKTLLNIGQPKTYNTTACYIENHTLFHKHN